MHISRLNHQAMKSSRLKQRKHAASLTIALGNEYGLP